MATPTPTVNMSSSTKVSDSQQAMQKLYPMMTTAQYNQYMSNKANFFKGTIAVCVTYAVFATALLLIALFSESAKEFIGNTIMPFTVTYVIGTIITVTVVAVLVSKYKPSIPVTNLYDRDVCPDYWTLEQTPASDLAGIPLETQALMKYRCRPNNSVYNHQTYFDANSKNLVNYQANDLTGGTSKVYNSDTQVSLPNTVVPNIYGQTPFNVSTNTSDPTKVRFGTMIDPTKINAKSDQATYNLVNGTGSDNKTYYLKDMYGNTAIGSTQIWNSTTDSKGTHAKNTMMCDMVYPNYLSTKDYLDFPHQPNQYRCSWAKNCGIPWTTACPDSNDTLPNDINVPPPPPPPAVQGSGLVYGPTGTTTAASSTPAPV